MVRRRIQAASKDMLDVRPAASGLRAGELMRTSLTPHNAIQDAVNTNSWVLIANYLQVRRVISLKMPKVPRTLSDFRDAILNEPRFATANVTRDLLRRSPRV